MSDTAKIWLMTGCCVFASLLFWLGFSGRDSYEDFQGLFPLFFWLLLMLIHLLAGSGALVLIWSQPSRWPFSAAVLYLVLAFVANVGLMLDWLGTDERIYVAVSNLVSPEDKALHQLLDEGADPAALQAALDAGADAHSWRGTWAIWKAVDPYLQPEGDYTAVKLLIRAGADPDARSRSGTSHVSFTYRVDGVLERLLVRRDKRTSLLCEILERRRNPAERPATDELLRLMFASGSDPAQQCGRLRRRYPAMELLLHDGEALAMLPVAAIPVVDAEHGEERLISSAAANDVVSLRALVNAVPAWQYRGAYQTALAEAVREGAWESVALLLESVAPPPGVIADAIAYADAGPDELAPLIAAKAALDEAGRKGRTPLAEAIRQRDLPMFRFLLAQGADANRTGLRYGALHEVFRIREDRERWQTLLLEADADIEMRDGNNHTFLMSAAYRLDKAGVALALAYDADRSPRDRRDRDAGQLALSQQADAELLALLQVSAEIAKPTPYELHSAVQRGDSEAVQRLLDHGADINDLSQRRSALETALAFEQMAVARQLLIAGADPDITSPAGIAIDRVIQPTTTGVLRHLRRLQKGEDAGIPLLFAAAMAGRADAVQLLLDAGADITARVAGEQTVLHMLAFSTKPVAAVIDLLVAAGADLNASNAAGETPAALATRQHKPEMAALLTPTPDLPTD